MDETNRICPWCSTPIPASATACPKCGALVEGAVAQEIPGLEARPDDAPIDPEAILPPSDAVRLEMRKIELEAQIENAGSEVMNPTGDESLDVGAPSEQAIAAYEAGLLDTTGPAGETDLGDLAAAWEDPELEKRVTRWEDAAEDPKQPE
ncbi:MAG: zinc ribbon domain-containing protein [Candidatus Limnocylindrales bacterium]|jgi:hypothetical protein